LNYFGGAASYARFGWAHASRAQQRMEMRLGHENC
jgi:hypothetical protein